MFFGWFDFLFPILFLAVFGLALGTIIGTLVKNGKQNRKNFFHQKTPLFRINFYVFSIALSAFSVNILLL